MRRHGRGILTHPWPEMPCRFLFWSIICCNTANSSSTGSRFSSTARAWSRDWRSSSRWRNAPKARAAEPPHRAIASRVLVRPTQLISFCTVARQTPIAICENLASCRRRRGDSRPKKSAGSPRPPICSGRTTSATAATASGSSSKISSNSRSHGFSAARPMQAPRLPVRGRERRAFSRTLLITQFGHRPQHFFVDAEHPGQPGHHRPLTDPRFAGGSFAQRGALAIVCNRPSRATCA